jgi:hypothetical protein
VLIVFANHATEVFKFIAGEETLLKPQADDAMSSKQGNNNVKVVTVLVKGVAEN